MVYSYLNIIPSDFTYFKQYSFINFDFKHIFQSISSLNWQKSSINKKFEFDTYELEFNKKKVLALTIIPFEAVKNCGIFFR